ncbi:LytR family transcriptional regulator [Bacillus luteolus]|uniref:Polyisoprenyl-teichoic acid--peptidoglycan teichoic acid transferase TagU n=1 Tax=Litchfieldia luteola TaxID=682179 RepID=A0ABR9QFH4_9BACI|nr:LytR family transcriptional regulator [Cytobacillus luteolus]MBE4907213.1 LytR family transcriptional regulator [Cytobacillus luteolus]MBP1943311.1 LCP family protein required for cell wall assembly [Cytobacillus luteolus]
MGNRNWFTFSNRKKILITSSMILLLLLSSFIIYAPTVYQTVKKTIIAIHEPIQREVSEKRMQEVVFEEKDPISFLLMGVDEREGDRGRSDSLIVITVNPNSQSLKMVSIPRDTRTEIIGKGFEDKINHAFAFGGIEMVLTTVEHFLDIPIDYFIKVNMESFKDIVDVLGGVTVNNPFAFESDGIAFGEGEIVLDGEQALSFARMRYDDPRGDFGRQDRQKQIIGSIMDKGAGISSIVHFKEILQTIGNNVTTNLTFEEMYDIQKNYKKSRHNLETLALAGEGTMINQIYYYIVSEDDKEIVIGTLKEHLEIQSE